MPPHPSESSAMPKAIIIRFPAERVGERQCAPRDDGEPASVIILPVVRVERGGSDPDEALVKAWLARQGNKRRRRRRARDGA